MANNDLEERVGENSPFDRTFIWAGAVIATIAIYSSVQCNYMPPKSVQDSEYKLEEGLNFQDKNLPNPSYTPLEEEKK